MVRQYLVVKPGPDTARTDLLNAYRSQDLTLLTGYVIELLGKLGALEPFRRDLGIEVASAPSLHWEPDLDGAPSGPDLAHDLEEFIVALEMHAEQVSALHGFIASNARRSTDDGSSIHWVGADPGGDLADHWCPGGAGLASFGRRSDARRTMHIDELHKGLLAGSGTSGSGNPRVNVVIIDQGLNKDAIRAAHRGNWGGGWKAKGRHPGKADRKSHGMLIARNVLDIAPDAVLYDVPLIPKPVISSVPVFASNAHAVYDALFAWIRVLRNHHRWSGSWIFVNAWAIYDRASETPLGDYTENTNSTDPQSPGHRLNAAIANAARYEKIDVVFAAGNCGTFCPASRCGKLDRGSGRSIWGGNSSSHVITAGAVLTNEMWVGYSSQGPGQDLLGSDKPDFCAPSVFAETTDAHVLNTGTSTACALTAGVVAALRQGWDASLVSPEVLRQTLIATARKVQNPERKDRFGHGVLDAGHAFQVLKDTFGPPQVGVTQPTPAAPPVQSPPLAVPASAIVPSVQPVSMKERGWLSSFFAFIRSLISR